MQFSADDTFASGHAALFAFASVPVGAHTVTLDYKSVNGSLVAIRRPAMLIRHS
jgi:hypothetical protein